MCLTYTSTGLGAAMTVLIIASLVLIYGVVVRLLVMAMHAVYFRDKASVYDLLFTKRGWLGKACGIMLLLLAPVTFAAAFVWVVLVVIATVAVTLLP